MNATRIFVIMGKEWAQTFNKWSAWNVIILLPAITTILLLLFIERCVALKLDLPDWAMDYFLISFVSLPALHSRRASPPAASWRTRPRAASNRCWPPRSPRVN